MKFLAPSPVYSKIASTPMLVLCASFAFQPYLASLGRTKSELEPSPPIPLVWRGGYLCVPMTLEKGQTAWFLFDTGCYRSFLTRRAYERLRASGVEVRQDGTLNARGASIGEYRLDSLKLAVEEDLFQFKVDGTADGYLGMDFLSKYKVELDLSERTMRLWPARAARPVQFTAEAGASEVPLLVRPEGYCIPLEVGNLTVPMVIDTGCSETFLHTDVATLLRDVKRKKGSRPMAFYNGLYRVRTIAVRSVRLGAVQLGDRSLSVAGVTHMVGILGRDLLTPMKLLLDYPGGRVTIASLKAEAPVSPVPPPRYEGPQVTYPNGVVVRWPLGIVALAPVATTFTLPEGYHDEYQADGSVVLVPPKGPKLL